MIFLTLIDAELRIIDWINIEEFRAFYSAHPHIKECRLMTANTLKVHIILWLTTIFTRGVFLFNRGWSGGEGDEKKNRF